MKKMRNQDSGVRDQGSEISEQEMMDKLKMVSEQIKELCSIHQVGYFGTVYASQYCSIDAFADPKSKTTKETVADIAVAMTNMIISFRAANKNIGLNDAENDELISLIVKGAKEGELKKIWTN